jgi:hypothetical protein
MQIKAQIENHNAEPLDTNAATVLQVISPYILTQACK